MLRLISLASMPFCVDAGAGAGLGVRVGSLDVVASLGSGGLAHDATSTSGTAAARAMACKFRTAPRIDETVRIVCSLWLRGAGIRRVHTEVRRITRADQSWVPRFVLPHPLPPH